jgi:hypothetical protein
MIELDVLLHEQIVEAVRRHDASLVPGLEPSPVRCLVEDLIDLRSEHNHGNCVTCDDLYAEGVEKGRCQAAEEAAQKPAPRPTITT